MSWNRAFLGNPLGGGPFGENPVRGELLDLASLGVIVHPKREWPRVGLSDGAKQGKCACPFHTTQRYVRREFVGKKVLGESRVSTFSLGGQTWVFDGHHTLAAYLLSGQEVLCWRHGPGNNVLPPPKLERKP